MKRVGFIGDVHGEANQLDALLRRIPESVEGLIFLGDYVNRGPSSRAVIERLVALSTSRPDTVFLAGNHDKEFLRAIRTGETTDFVRMGGARTVADYVRGPVVDLAAQLRDGVPTSHVDFLAGLVDRAEGDGYLAQHHPIGQTALGRRYGVFGHLPQRSREPRVEEWRALIDTGCGTWPDGRLTCFLWPNREWIQAGAEASAAVWVISS